MTSISVKSMPRPCAHSIRLREFVLVDAFERDRVDLDLQACGKRRVDAGQHLVQRAPARDGAEFLGVERIERDIDAPHAGRLDLARHIWRAASRWWSASARRDRPVRRCRDSELTRVMMPRRTSGSPPVRRSLRTPRATKARAQPVELFQRQNVGLGQEGHVLGHAIDAAEIATVGDRDAQIRDVAAERIDQRWPPGGIVEISRLGHRHAVRFHAAHRHALPRHLSHH